ncbi:MAG: HmuY family protein [Bacteroidota bacterium]
MRILLFVSFLLMAAPAMAQSIVVENMPSRSPGMGGDQGRFTLYSLRGDSLVAGPYDVVRDDSTSSTWDIGFLGIHVILNGGSSGPGDAAGALLDIEFEDLTEVPDEIDLIADGEGECPRGKARAVCSGSGNGWYIYEGGGVVNPAPGRTLLLRLADGGFAKLQMLSYGVDSNGKPGDRLFSFRYEIFD